jgi:hypothetical protein
MTVRAGSAIFSGLLGPCWLHQGTPENATGYVRCEINRVRDYVHRFVYRALVEPIPDGKEIDHQCHNADPSCPSDASCCTGVV